MSSPKAPPGKNYLPELDGLRFIAFLGVFLRHGLPIRVTGEIVSVGAVWDVGVFGVDLFFTLSAFLITRLLFAEQVVTGKISVRNFYFRRILRIWPLYFVFLALMWGLAHFAGLDPIPSRYWCAFLIFMGNWACAVWSYPHSGIFPLWSVGVEEQFYLIWPWLVKRLSRRRFIWMCVSLFALSLGVKAALALGGAVHPAAWCNTFGRLESIALGALLACRRPMTGAAKEGQLWLKLLAAFLLLVVANCFFPWQNVTLGSGLLTYPAAALASAVFITVAMQLRWTPSVGQRIG